MIGPVTERVRVRVAADFDGTLAGHDISHLDRVARLAARLAAEEGAERDLAGVAAYVHDYHRLVEHERGGAVAPEDAWANIAFVLTDCQVAAAWWPEIREAVKLTGRYGFAGDDLADASLAARCVRDADNLDAIGAIGIARSFMYGGAIAEPLWVPEAERLAVYREGATSSVIAHFYEKLVRLGADMLTDTGRTLAGERTAFLLEFLRRFHDEWGDAESAPIREVIAAPNGAIRDDQP